MDNNKQISNPYRKIGVLHNEGVSFVIKTLTPKEVTIEKIIDSTGQYIEKINKTTKPSDLALYCESIGLTINKLNQVPFEEVVRELKISKEGICFMKSIYDVSEDFDYPTALKIVENIEHNILNSEMTQEERLYPLLMVAVSKSSINYWIEQISDKKSPWIPFLGEDLARIKWPWKEDGFGAVGGAATGAIGGGLIGGIIGAVGGAIGWSVAHALFPED